MIRMISLIILALAATVIITFVGYSYFLHNQEKTTFSRGYTEGGFDKVRIGMSKVAVQNILGSPLKVQPWVPFDIWDYGKEWDKKEKKNGQVRFLITKSEQIFFDEHGLVRDVEGITSTGIKPGMKKDDVLKILGQPKHQFRSRAIEFHLYSLSPDVGRYKERSIGYDAQGKVCEIVKRELNVD